MVSRRTLGTSMNGGTRLAQHTSVARAMNTQDSQNRGSLARENKKHLLDKMKTDDEKYRERILKGYLGHLVSHTTKTSP